MLRIRLRRVGKKKQPAYRVVVADSRAPRDGAFVEVIGLYDPMTEPATINIDEEKARKWLDLGAQPSETAAKLLARQGVIPPLPPVTRTRKTPSEPETATAETPSQPEAKAPEKKEPEPETPEMPSQPETPETPSQPETKTAETPSESE